MRVHVLLGVSLTRTETLPPIARLRMYPRDFPQPFKALYCGRAHARGRARCVRII